MYHVPIPFIGRGPERTHFVCLECRVVSKETFPNHFLLSRRLDFSRPCEIELLCYLSFIRLNVVPSLLLTLSSSFRFFFSCFYFVQYKYNKIFGCIYLYWILISFQELMDAVPLEPYIWKPFCQPFAIETQLSQWRAAKMDFTIRSMRIDTLK